MLSSHRSHLLLPTWPRRCRPSALVYFQLCLRPLSSNLHLCSTNITTSLLLLPFFTLSHHTRLSQFNSFHLFNSLNRSDSLPNHPCAHAYYHAATVSPVNQRSLSWYRCLHSQLCSSTKLITLRFDLLNNLQASTLTLPSFSLDLF